MRAEEPLSFRVGIRCNLQLFDAPVAAEQIRRLDGHQAALADPLGEVLEGLAKLFRTALDVRLDRREVRVALAPLLDVAWLQEIHLLQQFQRPDGPVPLQAGFG